MSEIMTMKEIEKRYDKEWVLIENPERTKSEKLKSGTVLGHSRNKHRLYKKISQFKPKHFAVMYVGARADDLVYLL